MSTSISRRRLLWKSIRYAFGLTALLPFSENVFATKPAIYTGRNSDLALSGYDTVAYFIDEKPLKGNSNYVFEHLGVRWRFVNEVNLAKFKENPTDYMPQYGGYCAFSITKNKLLKSDPKQWVIHNNRLYLNFSTVVHRMWVSRIDSMIDKADRNWLSILG